MNVSQTPLLLIAGGTISMSGMESRSGFGGEALWLQQMPESKHLFGDKNLNSSCFRPRHWHEIRMAVEEGAIHANRPVIVTHGTDTLEQTAFILSLLLNGKLRKPVVLTGSLLPPTEKGSDALENIDRALHLATDPSTPPLVYGVFGKEIHLGSRLRKTRNRTPDPQTPYFELLGPSWNPDFLAWAGSRTHPGLDVDLRHLAPHRIVHQVQDGEGRWIIQRKGQERIIESAFIPPSLTLPLAAIKLSLLYAAGLPLEDLQKDMAGEIVADSSYRPPTFSTPLMEAIYVTQDLSAEDVDEAVERLLQRVGAPIRKIQSTSMLDAIGNAVSGGIEVIMGTSAFKTPSNLTDYELGNRIAGAGAQDSGGKLLDELLREPVTRPRLVLIGTGSGHIPIYD